MKTPEPTVEIFILSRNRLEYLPEAIASVLGQIRQGARLILSDNSTDARVADFMRSTYPEIEVRERGGMLTSYDHLNVVMSEVSSTYFMIFHDDDVLDASALGDLIDVLEVNPKASAAAGNAIVIYGTSISRELLNPSLKRDREFSDPADLIRRYFDFSQGVNPFPGYLYRRSLVAGLRFDVLQGGQYTDIVFLAEACRRGPIEWLSKPTLRYRKHGLNHSATASLRSAKRLIHFLESQDFLPKRSREARLFRYWNHFFFMKNSAGGRVRRRQRALVIAYFVKHPRSFLRRAWQKISAQF